MIGRLGLGTIAGLEAALADLGTAIELPPTPDLAAAVGARLHAATPSVAGPSRPAPVPIVRRRPIVRSLHRSLLLAAAITLLLVGGALGVRFGLQLLEIDFGPPPSPTASSSPGASPAAGVTPRASVDAGARLGLGLPSTFEKAAAAASIPLLVPANVGLPDRVYLGGSALRGQVAFLYRPRPDLPASELLAGAGLLVTQSRGTFDQGLAGKLVSSGVTTVQPVDVAGAPGYWLAGAPHMFWYLAPDGTAIQESQRQVGDTLVWERNGVLYRIEGAISRERAIEIAGSMRAP